MPLTMSPETDYLPSRMSEDYVEAVVETNRSGGEVMTTLDRPLYDRPLLYIAGFYSANPAHGLANACEWFAPALDAGWLPLVPHVTFLVDALAPRLPSFWYEYDKGLLLVCSAMFVCPDPFTKDSEGVNDEIAFAHAHDIPVLTKMLSPEEVYAR